MPLVTLAEVLREADTGGYAVGAFNCNNMEIVQAIINAAVTAQAPVIIQASQGAIKYAGLEYITSLVRTAASQAPVPVVLHLDHGTDFEQVLRCLRAGFTSVMIDGSKYPLEENIALTRKVVEIAHAMGASVEGELGRIGGTEEQIKVSEREATMTDPEEAQRFARETGVDALAVAIGTAHGRYHGTPRLDFERLATIDRLVPTPIVLHGSSGVPDDDIRRAVELGVRKINIDTDIRIAFIEATRTALDANPDEIDPRKVLGPARDAASKVISHKMQVFGCAGRVKK
ncbi:class II fructose-1,6-bisphosphate aldolase [Neomoorella thermoacetica]|uniref:Fructose-bisphosphate aldolase n=3 Tax=Neomoorella thermoacetica TaxID=1525 RepID=A0A1J5JTM5_NEOTH|nr:class II fructose-1,6-bisphosphate aldolase [Moorella thermoacetica]AKX95263.1 fructose-bisphosphate aldolase [Moorella thermoacetica]AKX97888.1 fructose-bisphosphate aldolase [Moorella thermoacetica]OIQ10067.1 fructose-bisphosphate aldolase [Moorella thermoacetica]OIQ54122.1 fructose-bisphosphate aldolase [Moorella thermoacetica]OIQ56719.1 fructose-bisphosphate aldolase [Moorella thermoacetica]